MVKQKADTLSYALVVDDDLLRMNVTEFLENIGFPAPGSEQRRRGPAGAGGPPSRRVLLFTDVEMPGDRNGFALAREVAVKWPTISVVVASGRLRPGDGDLHAGARFIAKPFSAKTVRDHLREVMPDARKPDALLD